MSCIASCCRWAASSVQQGGFFPGCNVSSSKERSISGQKKGKSIFAGFDGCNDTGNLLHTTYFFITNQGIFTRNGCGLIGIHREGLCWCILYLFITLYLLPFTLYHLPFSINHLSSNFYHLHFTLLSTFPIYWYPCTLPSFLPCVPWYLLFGK